MATRRHFLRDIAQASLATAGLWQWSDALAADLSQIDQANPLLTPEEWAQQEDYWATVRQAYTTSPNLINLNNGGVSPQPRLVQDKQQYYTGLSNEAPAYYMWRTLDQGRKAVKRELAALAGCSADEIAIVRNATEALENLLFGFDLQRGDEVLFTEHDYPNMRLALQQRQRREGIVLTEIPVEVPLTNPDELVAAYRKAISNRTKLILVSHMVFLTGQVFPVRDICRLGKEKGIPVVVDGAHSFAHVPYTMDELECDYFGTSLHKWLCAPFGTGMLYIRKQQIPGVWSLFGSSAENVGSMDKFEHQGTRSFPAEMAVGEAILFHRAIGADRKFARLQYLTRYWTDRVIDHPAIRLNTSLQGAAFGALCNVAIEGISPEEIASRLLKEYNVFTVAIDTANVQGVRITPHIYTTLRELDVLVEGMRKIAG